jgi:hypothetical protein
MGMQEGTPNAPDAFGLPEYFVTTIASETAGPYAVRYALGVRRFGEIPDAEGWPPVVVRIGGQQGAILINC